MKKNILIANMICDIILPKILLKMVYKCMFFFINFHDFTIIIVKNVLLGFFLFSKLLNMEKFYRSIKIFSRKKVFLVSFILIRFFQIFKKTSLNHIEVTYKDKIIKRSGTLYMHIRFLNKINGWLRGDNLLWE